MRKEDGKRKLALLTLQKKLSFGQTLALHGSKA
jgi:hypothetical protein